jgi:hypothetical protein
MAAFLDLLDNDEAPVLLENSLLKRELLERLMYKYSTDFTQEEHCIQEYLDQAAMNSLKFELLPLEVFVNIWMLMETSGFIRLGTP